MTALEQLAQAVLDGRVHIEMNVAANAFGVPTGASFYVDVDPIDDDPDPDGDDL